MTRRRLPVAFETRPAATAGFRDAHGSRAALGRCTRRVPHPQGWRTAPDPFHNRQRTGGDRERRYPARRDPPTHGAGLPPGHGVGRARDPLPAQVRFSVLQRDGFRCRYCGRTGSDPRVVLHVGYVVPLAAGGATREDKLRTACEECNLGKAARTPMSAGSPWKRDRTGVRGHRPRSAGKHGTQRRGSLPGDMSSDRPDVPFAPHPHVLGLLVRGPGRRHLPRSRPGNPRPRSRARRRAGREADRRGATLL